MRVRLRNGHVIGPSGSGQRRTCTGSSRAHGLAQPRTSATRLTAWAECPTVVPRPGCSGGTGEPASGQRAFRIRYQRLQQREPAPFPCVQVPAHLDDLGRPQPRRAALVADVREVPSRDPRRDRVGLDLAQLRGAGPADPAVPRPLAGTAPVAQAQQRTTPGQRKAPAAILPGRGMSSRNEPYATGRAPATRLTLWPPARPRETGSRPMRQQRA